jgi:hypothetical protein
MVGGDDGGGGVSTFTDGTEAGVRPASASLDVDRAVVVGVSGVVT